jgi:hypothetical protein
MQRYAELKLGHHANKKLIERTTNDQYDFLFFVARVGVGLGLGLGLGVGLG